MYIYKIAFPPPFFLFLQDCPGATLQGSADEHREEVGGEVLPARLAPSPWPPFAIEREEHGAAPVPPAQRGVGVVAILLNAFRELAVGAELLLAEEGRG